MFFAASKIFGIVIVHPVNVLVLAIVVGLIVAQIPRLRRSGRMLAVVAASLFLLACYSPLSHLLLRPLEDRFPQPTVNAPPAGIIVLGGAMDGDISEARGQTTLTEAASRLTTGAALAHRFPDARLVFTGGSSDLRQAGVDEARGVRELWLSLGLPPTRMTFEDRSRNTYENAAMTKALVAPKPGETWLLVTSAWHMPRSVGIFRKAGWPVTAYPVDYHTFGDRRDWKIVTVPTDALHDLTIALHEWVGLFAYRAAGKTDALFPAP